jgi:Tfp pilus assembly protein PilN
MRAVNLIPGDERRGGPGSSGGLGSYILVGVLVLVVGVSAATTFANRSIAHRRDELTVVQARAQAAAAEAQALQSYTSFGVLRQKRSETVRSLAVTRFDWSHALHEIARTIPSDAWLTSLRATVTPAVAVESGTTDPLRASVQAPAIEIVGCTTSQDKVANVITSLRRVNGVQRVSLSSSEKLARTGAASGGGAASGSAASDATDCRQGNGRFPQFSLTLFFATPSASPTVQSTAKGTTP